MTDYVTDYVRHAGQVKRYHTWPCIQVQTVGEHSWQVALVYEQIFGELSPAIERFIRLHDAPELVIGDMPFPVKSQNPTLKIEFDGLEEGALKRMGVGRLPELHPDIRRRIKICDLLEMMLFGMTECELGNKLAIPIISRTKKAALDMAVSLPEDEYEAVRRFIKEAKIRHNQVFSQREEE